MENQHVNELTITREFNAPRELLFDMWTNPVHLQKWWGPKDFTNPVCDWNAKEGNKLFVEMKAPDGISYPMDGEFIEIKRPRKLVFISAALDADGKRLFEVLNTVLFSEENGKTKMTMTAKVSKEKNGSEHMIAGMDTGWSQSLDRLETFLHSHSIS